MALLRRYLVVLTLLQLQWWWGAVRTGAFVDAPRRRTRSDVQQRCFPNAVSYSLAGPADADAATTLTVECFFGDLGQDFGFNNNRATAFYRLGAEQAADLQRSLASPDDTCVKATDSGGRVVGFVRMRRGRTVDNLAVDPKWRRRGVASALLRTAAARAPPATIELELFVDEDNAGAVAFYQSQGWVVESRVHGSRYQVSWWRGLFSEPSTQLRMIIDHAAMAVAAAGHDAPSPSSVVEAGDDKPGAAEGTF